MIRSNLPKEYPASSYIIASSPRTGSYLLCEGLAATGLAGCPTEPFCTEYRAEFCRRWKLPLQVQFDDFLQAAIQNGTTANGVFGVKIHFNELCSLARGSGHEVTYTNALRHIFATSKYIHLSRRDRRAQAISYYRALVTRIWWRIEGVENHQATDQEPDFDSPKIRQAN
jgi:LPS sulfotransferase NodH